MTSKVQITLRKFGHDDNTDVDNDFTGVANEIVAVVAATMGQSGEAWAISYKGNGVHAYLLEVLAAVRSGNL